MIDSFIFVYQFGLDSKLDRLELLLALRDEFTSFVPLFSRRQTQLCMHSAKRNYGTTCRATVWPATSIREGIYSKEINHLYRVIQSDTSKKKTYHKLNNLRYPTKIEINHPPPSNHITLYSKSF